MSASTYIDVCRLEWNGVGGGRAKIYFSVENPIFSLLFVLLANGTINNALGTLE
jgi:hypothetical protein